MLVIIKNIISKYSIGRRKALTQRSKYQLSTLLLNWNRVHLLRTTVESYLETVSVPYELIIVDNASSDGATEYIKNVCKWNPQRHKAVLLKENLGGEAINLGLSLAQAPFLHISENDLEYLPGWDTELLQKFKVFPKLWQLSPFGPEPEAEKGEIWEEHPSKPVTRGRYTIYLADANIGTSCICRRELFDIGFRWRSHPAIELGSGFKFPDDGATSSFVKGLGYWVAWNDKYTVINWGHNVEEWEKNLNYYLSNYQAMVEAGRHATTSLGPWL